MAVSGRYIHSDLKLQTGFDDAQAANSIAVDIAGYYEGPTQIHKDFNGRWRAGFNISNLGPKMKYDDRTDGAFLPTNLDRKSTRLNSSHVAISYAVFCLKKKNHV